MLQEDTPTIKGLSYVNVGLHYDPNAVDLLRAKLVYNFKLGKQNEAIAAYLKLSAIAPNHELIKCLSKKEGFCFNPN